MTELEVGDDEALVINGWTSVKRFFDKNDDCLELVWSWLFDRSLAEDIKVWIFGDVVPGGINVTKGDDDVPVEFVCWGLRI